MERSVAEVGWAAVVAPGNSRRLGHRVGADDDQPLGSEIKRGLDRRVQTGPTIEVPAAYLRGALDSDGREQDRNRRRGTHVRRLEAGRHILDDVGAVQ